MKLTKTSFLFFSLLILISNTIYSQLVDSTSYYSSLIQNPKNDDDLAKVFKFFKIYEEESIDKGLITKQIYALQNIADIQKKLGYVNESERLNIKTLVLLDSVDTSDWYLNAKVKTLNDLGMVYRYKKDYKEALEIYKKALTVAYEKSDINTILNNIGFVFQEQSDFKKALDQFQLAYSNATQNNDSLHIARSLDNLGFTKSKLNLNGAEKNMKDALNIRIEKKHHDGVYTSYDHLSRHFNFVKDSLEALLYSDKALDLARSTNSLEQLESALLLKIDIGYDSFAKEYVSIVKKKVDKDQFDRNNFNYYVYQYDKKEKELQKSRLENERQKKENLIYLFSTLLILIGSILLYFILKSKHRKDKIRQAYLKETELSKKVHDEIANDMSDIINYVENDIETSNDRKTLLLDNLEDVYLRTRDISTETGSIDLINFSQSLSNLLLQHNREGTKVVINDINTIDWHKVPDYKKTIVFRCLQELMVNMKKHSNAKLVSIVFKQYKGKKEIRYVDDGIGVSVEEIKLSGLLNVESRINSIQGTFNFITSKGNGFKATLEFNS